MNTIDSWKRYGLIHQTSSEEIDLDQKVYTFYCGFDPTGDSLHLGHLFVLITMKKLQALGHKPIAVIGGATGMIGDPSGKSKERVLLDEQTIEKNINGISRQIATFINLEQGGRIVNNMDWFKRFSFIGFLRDVGKMFRLGEMIAKESVQKRLNSEEGISFTEFSYQILQSYDFYHLCQEYNCDLQVGGSDQWGNITAGIDLIRKKLSKPVYGITLPLIKSSNGEKFGKTAQGENLWLDPQKTTPYQFYQFWLQTDDSLVISYLRFFTFLQEEKITEIEEKMKLQPEERLAQKTLAYEVTLMIHGEQAAQKAINASLVLFGGSIEGMNDQDLISIFRDVPSITISRQRLASGELFLDDLFVESNLASSKGNAKKLAAQGGAYLNNQRYDDPKTIITEKHLASDNILILRSGRKNYALVRFEFITAKEA